MRDKEAEIYKVKKVIEKKKTYSLDTQKFDNHWNYRYKFQVRGIDKINGKERWVDITKYKILYPEQTNNDGMKYLLYENTKSNKLAVIFQAINKSPSYNYVGTLSDIPINKLFIKDDYGHDKATKSSYYLGYKKDFKIAIATQKLIEKVINDLNIEKTDTIFLGSSKGGFAALYHGYLFGAGHILPGGPQILLGNYLDKGHDEQAVGKEIFKSIIGEINKDNKQWANNLIFDMLKDIQKPFPNTVIHVGYWEPHFRNHVLPFMEKCKELRIKNITLITKNYGNHSELAEYYPIFLKEQIKNIISE